VTTVESSEVVDEAVEAAAGTRTAARWLASALGAVPSLAVLSSVVRAPGNAGFDLATLAAGVGLAALGAIVGVLGFARVIAPVPLEDTDLRDLDLKRIPGQPYTTFDELNNHMDAIRSAAAGGEYAVAEATAAAHEAEAEAAAAEAEATRLEAEATEPGNQEAARRARSTADAKRRESTAAHAQAASEAARLPIWTDQLVRREAIRRDAYRLLAADKVGRRYLQARILAVIAVGLIAAGVVLLGLAPKSSTSSAPHPHWAKQSQVSQPGA
jgi:hypothetical protein